MINDNSTRHQELQVVPEEASSALFPTTSAPRQSTPAERDRLVKAMAVYGRTQREDHSLDALYALGTFVIFSSQDQKPTAPIVYFEPFALDAEWGKRPSEIALTIDLGVITTPLPLRRRQTGVA
jgi:hypothetical protein